jgi:fucose permease
MSFLHSFYALGHIITIVIATLFFTLFKIDNWYILSLIFIIIPLIEISFFISCPIIAPKGDEIKIKKRELFKNKTFIILFLLMIMAGASEQAIAQCASFFAEAGLKVSKSLGDLLGACLFAFFMFISRMWYGIAKKKPKITNTIFIFSIGLVFCYILTVIQPSAVASLIFIALCGFFVGILWPGIYSIGGGIFESGGTVMFSMLALGGDVGCSLGPLLVGFVADFSNIKAGILSATIFPLLLIIGMLLLIKLTKEKKGGII